MQAETTISGVVDSAGKWGWLLGVACLEVKVKNFWAKENFIFDSEIASNQAINLGHALCLWEQNSVLIYIWYKDGDYH